MGAAFYGVYIAKVFSLNDCQAKFIVPVVIAATSSAGAGAIAVYFVC